MLTLQILCLFEPLLVETSDDMEEEEGPAMAANVLEICKTAEEIPASLESVRERERREGKREEPPNYGHL